MKSASVAMQAHIAQEVTTLARCRKVTRKDGSIFAYTTHDQDLIIDGVTYRANGIFIPGAIQADNALGVPNQEAVGAITATDITYEELVAEKFNGAQVEEFYVNWADLSMGKIILPGDKFGTVTPEDNHFRAEIRGKVDRLRCRTGEVTQPSCRASLFQTAGPVWQQCGLNADDYKQSGVVTGVNGKVLSISGVNNSIPALITETLTIPPTTTPWEFTGGINGAFDFGDHSGTAPVVGATAISPGDKITIGYQSGWVKISDSERPHVDANGQTNDISGDTTGSSGNYFPTHYAVTGKSTEGKGGAMLVFTDGSGNVIEVHADGNSGSYTAPAGAAAYQLGINDDKLSDNLGTGFKINVYISKGISVAVKDLSQFSQGGRIKFTSGDLDGYQTEIKLGATSGSPAVDTFTLYLATRLAVQVGNTFDCWPSCDKLPTTCLNKFNNLMNFKGFKYLPGVDAARTTQLVKLP